MDILRDFGGEALVVAYARAWTKNVGGLRAVIFPETEVLQIATATKGKVYRAYAPAHTNWPPKATGGLSRRLTCEPVRPPSAPSAGQTFTQNIKLKARAVAPTQPAATIAAEEIDPDVHAIARKRYRKGLKSSADVKPEEAVRLFFRMPLKRTSASTSPISRSPNSSRNFTVTMRLWPLINRTRRIIDAWMRQLSRCRIHARNCLTDEN